MPVPNAEARPLAGLRLSQGAFVHCHRGRRRAESPPQRKARLHDVSKTSRLRKKAQTPSGWNTD